ncbi:uncharacterized protein LTR77_001543 [Saxophila tyrrhenica]|uniref:AB hydrolase-1 domain-containing protein n=1 Tax=Saxophila tyrrhenica TaxID=1690608 RepID=A0AAV9PKR6_9PEZI|nr:hypothetical protein LTR77_001543 [Saxophila tyrrhenica]
MKGFKVVEHQIPTQHIREYTQATANTQEDVLYLQAKQYIPLSNPHPQRGDVTILAAHANALAKELYEPLWEDLLAQCERYRWRIRSIWITDVAHQGQSGVLNEHLLGNEPSWHDHVRDLLFMVNLKRTEMPRPIIGIGHSMGGNQLTHLSLMHPRLFSSLILLDPVIQERSAEIDPSPNAPPNLAQLSTFRRDLWPSRDDAAASFARSAFYKPWDPRVLEKWTQYGLRNGPTLLQPEAKSPQVTLTSTPGQEVFTYLRPNFQGFGVNGKPVDRSTHADLDPSRPNQYPFYRNEAPQIYARLPEVRPSVLYVFGSTSGVSSEKSDQAKVDRTGTGVGGSGGVAEGRVKGVTFEGVGHLIPMEAVEKTASTVADWVGTEMVRFRDEMEVWDAWQSKSLVQKQGIDETWKKMIGGRPRRAGKL